MALRVGRALEAEGWRGVAPSLCRFVDRVALTKGFILREVALALTEAGWQKDLFYCDDIRSTIPTTHALHVIYKNHSLASVTKVHLRRAHASSVDEHFWNAATSTLQPSRATFFICSVSSSEAASMKMPFTLPSVAQIASSFGAKSPTT